jgi:hypothetical protein
VLGLRQLSPLLIAACVAVPLSVGYVFLVESEPEPPPAESRTSEGRRVYQGPESTPFSCPGITRPPTLPAAEAKVADDTEVIGVSAAGRHRAYVVLALAHMTHHVVNDLLGEVPITVTHCSLSGCNKVFTDSKPAVLDVWVGGIVRNRMLLRVGSTYYVQETGKPEAKNMPPFPYPEHPFEQTTWGAWKTAHPDTDIYCGDLPKPDRPDAVPPGVGLGPPPPGEGFGSAKPPAGTD